MKAKLLPGKPEEEQVLAAASAADLDVNPCCPDPFCEMNISLATRELSKARNKIAQLEQQLLRTTAGVTASTNPLFGIMPEPSPREESSYGNDVRFAGENTLTHRRPAKYYDDREKYEDTRPHRIDEFETVL